MFRTKDGSVAEYNLRRSLFVPIENRKMWMLYDKNIKIYDFFDVLCGVRCSGAFWILYFLDICDMG